MSPRETIDFVLAYAENIKQAIEDKRNDSGRGKVGGNGSGHCRRSDPTMIQAFRNMMPVGTVEVPFGCAINGRRDIKPLRNAEKWLYVGKATWENFEGKRCGELMQKKYKESKRLSDILAEMKISKTRYYVLLDSMYRFAENYARGNGALPPFRRRILNEGTTSEEQSTSVQSSGG